VLDVDIGEAVHVSRSGVSGNYLYLLFNFTVNLKLSLKKDKAFKNAFLSPPFLKESFTRTI
jgi:hypothetical protein